MGASEHGYTNTPRLMGMVFNMRIHFLSQERHMYSSIALNGMPAGKMNFNYCP